MYVCIKLISTYKTLFIGMGYNRLLKKVYRPAQYSNIDSNNDVTMRQDYLCLRNLFKNCDYFCKSIWHINCTLQLQYFMISYTRFSTCSCKNLKTFRYPAIKFWAWLQQTPHNCKGIVTKSFLNLNCCNRLTLNYNLAWYY